MYKSHIFRVASLIRFVVTSQKKGQKVETGTTDDIPGLLAYLARHLRDEDWVEVKLDITPEAGWVLVIDSLEPDNKSSKRAYINAETATKLIQILMKSKQAQEDADRIPF